MEHVEVLEPSTVEQIAGHVYVGVPDDDALDHGKAVPEVSGILVALCIRGCAVSCYVKVFAVGRSDSAAAFLEVAAPRVALLVQGNSIREDVEPSIFRVDRSESLVESERSEITRFVGGPSVGSDMVRARGVMNRGEPGFVELQHLVESRLIRRPPLVDVVGCVFRYVVLAPARAHEVVGLLMLQPRHSAFSM